MAKKGKGSGWHKNPRGHAMAAKGIATKKMAARGYEEERERRLDRFWEDVQQTLLDSGFPLEDNPAEGRFGPSYLAVGESNDEEVMLVWGIGMEQEEIVDAAQAIANAGYELINYSNTSNVITVRLPEDKVFSASGIPINRDRSVPWYKQGRQEHQLYR